MSRFIKVLVRGFLGLLALLIIVLAGLATPPGRSMLASAVESMASTADLQISISRLSGWPPFYLGADRITVTDRQGTVAEVENLGLDLHVGALLIGRLVIDEAVASRIRLARLPAPGTENASSEGGGSVSLIPVGRLSIGRLELGAPIAGSETVVTIAGAIGPATDGGFTGRIEAERIDGRRGRLTGTFTRSADGARLTADLAADEAANGLLSGLMKLPEAPAYRLAVKAAGDGEGVDGTATITSDRDARFAGRFVLTPEAEGGRRLSVDGEGDLTQLLPGEWVDLLGGPLRLAVNAGWRAGAGGAPSLDIRQGRLTTGAVSAEAAGRFGGTATDLSLNLRVANPRGGAIRLPAALGSGAFDNLNLTGKALPRGNGTRVELTGRLAGLVAGDLSVPGLGLSLAVEGAIGAPGKAPYPFALRAEANAIVTPDGRITATSDRPIILTADGAFDPAAMSAGVTAALTIAGGKIDFAGPLSPSAGSGKLGIDLPDLAALAPLARRPIAGALALTADGTLYGPGGLKVAVKGTSRNLEPGGGPKGLLAGETRFGGTVSQDRNGRLDLADLTIAGSTVSADGRASLDATTVNATLSGRLANLAVLAPASSGAATFIATLSGPRERPNIDATLGIDQGRLLDRPIDRARLTIKGAPAANGWQATLGLSGSFAGQPLTGRAEASLDAANRPSLPVVDLSIGGNRISGALQPDAAGLLTGTLNIDAPDMRTMAALVLAEAAGNAKATIRFQPEQGRQSVALNFSGRDVAVGTSRVARLDGEATVADAFGTPLVRGTLNAGSVAIGGMRLDTATASANVEGGATRFEATARGPDVNLTTAGRLAAAGGENVLEIQRFSGTAFGLPTSLVRPATIRMGSATRIAGLELDLAGGRIIAEGTAAPRYDLTLTLRNLPASAANRFSPGLGAEGTISGTARVTGEGRPSAAWQIDWSGMRLAQTRATGLPPLQITARGNAGADMTTVDAKLNGGGLALDVSGQVPFGGGALDLRARGAAPLALAAISAGREVRLGGTARLDLIVTGSTAAPNAAGTIDLAEAMFADPMTGFGVSGANGRIRLEGKTARIERVTGRLTQGGEINLAGTVGIDPASGMPANLTLKIANGRYSDGVSINTGFGADLTITGPLARDGVVAGRVDLGRTEILLPDKIGGTTTAIPVRHRNAASDFRPPLKPKTGTAGAGSSGGGLRLNLEVNNTSVILVRGFGLDAELGGSIRIGGTTGNPQTVGAFDMRRGRMEVIGKRFEFTRGTLTFSGSTTPVVDFVATTQTSEATVTLNVTGPASDPVIAFSSTPELPQEEVLSRLLLDRSVGSLSPLQAAQLVDAAAQLSGALGRGNGLFDRLRKATGLDDLDIRQNKSGGTTVGVGRRINDRIRLGVEQDTSTGTGRVTVDLDINKNLKARGETGQDGSGKLGLTYEKEY